MATVAAKSLGNTLLRLRIGQKDDAPTSSGAAYFGRQCPVAGGDLDQLFNGWGGDFWRIGLAQLPLLAQQTRNFIPVSQRKRLVHGPGDRADTFKILENLAFAVEVVLEYLPVVNA